MRNENADNERKKHHRARGLTYDLTRFHFDGVLTILESFANFIKHTHKKSFSN